MISLSSYRFSSSTFVRLCKLPVGVNKVNWEDLGGFCETGGTNSSVSLPSRAAWTIGLVNSVKTCDSTPLLITLVLIPYLQPDSGLHTRQIDLFLIFVHAERKLARVQSVVPYAGTVSWSIAMRSHARIAMPFVFHLRTETQSCDSDLY
jgi:hypothetical protein